MELDPKQPPATLATAVLCIQCGYDLQGLTLEAQCPECGLPVEKSARGDSLRERHPGYLKRLHTGAVLVQTSLAMFVLCVVLTILSPVVSSTNPRGADVAIMVFAIIAVLGFLIGSVLYPIGWLFLTARDPGRTNDERGQRSRRLVRATVIFLVAAMAVVFGFSIFGSLFLRNTTLNDDFVRLMLFISWVLQLVMLIAWIVQYYASMVYLRWLAARIPSERVFKRAKLLMWLGPILLLLFCLFIPPLIAVVLYYNMLSWIRTDLKAIRSEQAAAAA